MDEYSGEQKQAQSERGKVAEMGQVHFPTRKAELSRPQISAALRLIAACVEIPN